MHIFVLSLSVQENVGSSASKCIILLFKGYVGIMDSFRYCIKKSRYDERTYNKINVLKKQSVSIILLMMINTNRIPIYEVLINKYLL